LPWIKRGLFHVKYRTVILDAGVVSAVNRVGVGRVRMSVRMI